jgi:cation diffusion facilitator family transporter
MAVHSKTYAHWQHQHNFNPVNLDNVKRTRWVLILTLITMLIEIIAGTWFNSMALLADGWHMATHATAFAIALFAYYYAAKYANSERYTFGTGKVGVLGGFSSALLLAIVAAIMLYESGLRLVNPQPIQFNEAIGVAVLGLAINLVSAWLLGDAHHDHDHDHDHDHNLHAAYVHVLADALTSIFAILALVAGKYLGWMWLDPVMGIVGAILITRWAYYLIKSSSSILLDESIASTQRNAIKQLLEQDQARVVDLHIWQVGTNSYALMASVISHQTHMPEYYRQLLKAYPRISHITVETIPCEDGQTCPALAA